MKVTFFSNVHRNLSIVSRADRRRDRRTDDDIDMLPVYANALKMTHVHRSLTDKALTPAVNTKSRCRYCVVFMVVTTTCVASVDVGDTFVT